jgi:transcriptional regulator with PAS, ATPase and Fis domain
MQIAEVLRNESDPVTLEALEINMIRKVLHSCKYNLQSAADLLGIHRDALSRRMKKYHINLTINQE